MIRLPLLGATLLVSVPMVLAQGQTLQTGFFRVALGGPGTTRLEVDPSGHGQYVDTLWRAVGIDGARWSPDTRTEVTDDGADALTAHIGPLAVAVSQTHDTPPASSAVQVPAGQTLVQPFLPEGDELLSVSVSIPTWATTDSAATLRLRQESPTGPIVAERRLEALVDNARHVLDLSGQGLPGGRWYYLELAEVQGVAGFWVSGGNAEDPDWALRVADQTQPATRATLFYTTASIYQADLSLTLRGPELTMRITPEGDAAVHALMVWPFERDDYDTSNPGTIPFRYLVTEDGRYIPIHQFKRRSVHPVSTSDRLYLSGLRGFDVRFTFPEGASRWDLVMNGEEMRIQTRARAITMAFEPESRWLPDYFPRFTASDERAASLLTEFLYSHGMNFGMGVNPDWAEWESLVFAWQQSFQEEQLKSWIAGGYQMTPEGYLHSWGADPGWPFPFKDDDGDGANDYDTRHFTTDPCFVLGAWRQACWTRDDGFIEQAMPRCRKAMDFMLNDLHGRDGLILAIGPLHTGADGGIGNNYWDIQPFGHLDAFANSYYYASLEAMAELEDWAGEAARAEELRGIRDLCKKRYNEVFWNDAEGRFVGCVDRDGVAHDYGFTFVNLDAMAYGLASEEQARRIHDWMEHGLSSSGEADIYSRWVFAPRANTIHNPGREEKGATMLPWWSWVWGGTAWEDQCQDGGAILYTSFSDIMARVRYRGADDAWQRLSEILDRYAMPDHLSGGSPLSRGERSQGGPGGGPGQVGVEGEFPESGMVPSSFLHAFLGLNARPDGLHIRPNRPTSLGWIGVENARYAGGRLDVRVDASEVALTWTPNTPADAQPLSLHVPVPAPGEGIVFRPWEGTAETANVEQ